MKDWCASTSWCNRNWTQKTILKKWKWKNKKGIDVLQRKTTVLALMDGERWQIALMGLVLVAMNRHMETTTITCIHTTMKISVSFYWDNRYIPESTFVTSVNISLSTLDNNDWKVTDLPTHLSKPLVTSRADTFVDKVTCFNFGRYPAFHSDKQSQFFCIIRSFHINHFTFSTPQNILDSKPMAKPDFNGFGANHSIKFEILGSISNEKRIFLYTRRFPERIWYDRQAVVDNVLLVHLLLSA